MEYLSKPCNAVSWTLAIAAPIPPETIVGCLELDDAKRVISLTGSAGDYIIFKDFGFTFTDGLTATAISLFINGSELAASNFDVWSTLDGSTLLEEVSNATQGMPASENDLTSP